MIYITGSNPEAVRLVHAALCRSVSRSQVTSVTTLPEPSQQPISLVIIDPTEDHLHFLLAVHRGDIHAKVLLLGKLPEALATALGLQTTRIPEAVLSSAACDSAPAYSFRDSPLRIVYQQPLGELQSPLHERAFLHYDFREEWNNLAYGAVRTDDSIWSLAQGLIASHNHALADVMIDERRVATYVSLWDSAQSSLLWFNRSVGPIDSQEWRLVDYFFASYRHTDLPCTPVLSEIPYGYDAAVTMRLDCDEDIESARALFEHYQAWDVPFSLAIHSAVLADAKHHALVREVAATGGAILSHSATHPVNWGGSYAAAFEEANVSLQAINAVLQPENAVKYAVSPFHQTPPYALQALSDAGYLGCVGGIVCNDPEFLIARAGELAGCASSFIGHSQSCMLHGECLLNEDDPLRIYKEAFDIAKRGRAFFGFLDHPFSERYAYGWASEVLRIEMHRRFIEYIRSQGRVLFLNENDALDFLRDKNAIELTVMEDGYIISSVRNKARKTSLKIAVEYANQLFPLTEEGVPA